MPIHPQQILDALNSRTPSGRERGTLTVGNIAETVTSVNDARNRDAVVAAAAQLERDGLVEIQHSKPRRISLVRGRRPVARAVATDAPEDSASGSYDSESNVDESVEDKVSPTAEQYAAFESLYQRLNDGLFEGRLPGALLTFSRKAKTHGFFIADAWTADGRKASEIALNPDGLTREARLWVSTLVHEMVHQRQHIEGTPSRRGYHNAEWARMMDEVGLAPSTTGEIGGKRVGQRVTHYIVSGGPFDLAFDSLDKGALLPFLPVAESGATSPQKPRGACKLAYSCPQCSLKMWGKPGAKVMCGECRIPLNSDSTPAHEAVISTSWTPVRCSKAERGQAKAKVA